MKNRSIYLYLLIVACFSFSSTFAQSPKIIGQPFKTIRAFSEKIQQIMKVPQQDTWENGNGISNTYRVRLNDSTDKKNWAVIDFEMNEDSTVSYVSVTSEIPKIIELYAMLYDNSIRKKDPGKIRTFTKKGGEVIRIRTDEKPGYSNIDGFWGVIEISKD